MIEANIYTLISLGILFIVTLAAIILKIRALTDL